MLNPFVVSIHPGIRVGKILPPFRYCCLRGLGFCGMFPTCLNWTSHTLTDPNQPVFTFVPLCEDASQRQIPTTCYMIVYNLCTNIQVPTDSATVAYSYLVLKTYQCLRGLTRGAQDTEIPHLRGIQARTVA